MSATAIQPDPQQSGFVVRLLTTPLETSLRGKGRSHETVASLLAEAGLPSAISDLIRHVLRRTRLWHSARIEVARELIAHFEDGLAQEVSEEELIRSFGDPIQAARLIGRAKRWCSAAPLTLVLVTICTALLTGLFTIYLYSCWLDSRGKTYRHPVSTAEHDQPPATTSINVIPMRRLGGGRAEQPAKPPEIPETPDVTLAGPSAVSALAFCFCMRCVYTIEQEGAP